MIYHAPFKNEQVAYHNLDRIRLVWSRIWRVLEDHFVKVCSHPVLSGMFERGEITQVFLHASLQRGAFILLRQWPCTELILYVNW